jgi:hypothetical protein
MEIRVDFTFPYLVTAAHLDMRAFPDSNATGERPDVQLLEAAL